MSEITKTKPLRKKRVTVRKTSSTPEVHIPVPHALNDREWAIAMKHANEVFGRAFAGLDVDEFVQSLRRG